METTNSFLLNRVFTRSTFRELIDEGESAAYTAAIKRYIQGHTKQTNKECISKIYHVLQSQYQNEYYYKNTLLNKLLLGIHSPRTTTALTEVPIGNSKADFILINGKAVVYEIKTALDNFDRLDGQVADYYKAFTRVVVVTAESNFAEIQERLADTPVGICILTPRGTLSIRKEPEEYVDILSKSAMFKILRKDEQEQIILEHYGCLPPVSQFEYYRACKDLFEKLPTETAYNDFIRILKKRSKIEIEEYEDVPYELKFLIYFSKLRKKDYAKLKHFLNT